MRIASYNIRKAVGLDWKRSGDRILRVLEEIDADVVLLQESDKRIGQRAGVLPVQELLERLGYRLVDLSTRPLSHGWHGNAILYRERTLSLEGSSRIELPSLEPRGAVSALFGTPRLEVIGVHLALARSIRAGQLKALRHHLIKADHPVLIAGDFNAWRHDPGIAAALGDDCRMILPGNSFHASRPSAPLDRFVLQGVDEEVNAHVHGSALAARASDHLPIVLDVDLSKLKP
ncbi:endonuclease/exonuclease/phosphatase family protein [Roseovarius sp. Pro17]|uniref:endonuclease/exonuclease/phosphatase family protein n=1 Tax=Roseovarius sp. Pro17 TaxID=3108175 RepID=UPI002D78AD5B|nr:endonuclease/exonuclease/phosphatase family protein [Roseovarius sp. Pro17]